MQFISHKMELAACEKPFSNTLQRVKADIRNSLRYLLDLVKQPGNHAFLLCVQNTDILRS